MVGKMIFIPTSDNSYNMPNTLRIILTPIICDYILSWNALDPCHEPTLTRPFVHNSAAKNWSETNNWEGGG